MFLLPYSYFPIFPGSLEIKNLKYFGLAFCFSSPLPSLEVLSLVSWKPDALPQTDADIMLMPSSKWRRQRGHSDHLKDYFQSS